MARTTYSMRAAYARRGASTVSAWFVRACTSRLKSRTDSCRARMTVMATPKAASDMQEPNTP